MKNFDKGLFQFILIHVLIVLVIIGIGVLMYIGIYHLINHYIDIPAIIETFKR